MQHVKIGQAVRRLEDQRFLTGQGRYIDDMTLPGMAHAAVLRSPHAHARIESIDAQAALAAPGVLLVLTGQEWVGLGFGSIPTKNPVTKRLDGTPFANPEHHCLAVGEVRHVGEAVAFIVAETAQQARDAAELIDVRYDERPAVTDPMAAIAPGAPLVWDTVPGNFCVDYQLGDKAATDAAFGAAAHTIALDIVNNRLTATAMEPRGVLASWDAKTDSYTLHNSSMNIHSNRDTLAQTILKIPKTKLRHVAPDVGGGFGVKNSVYAEPALALYAAKRLDRPVKWVADRSESFASDAHGRDQVSHVELALDKDGTFQALRVMTVGNVGAWCGTMGPFTSTAGTARTQGGTYRFPTMLYTAKAVFTNTSQTDPYRGAGRPEATFHVERIIEFAARKLGFDPVELRRNNLIPRDAHPYKSAMGLDIDSGDFPELFRRALDMSDYKGFAARAVAAKARGQRRGYAITPYLECTGGQANDHAGITFHTDGTVGLAVGTHSTGMGHETSLSQILSDRLGVPLEHITFAQADTDATPIGGGHGGSRSMEVGGNAIAKAADEIIGKARTIAAHLLNSRAEDLSFADGRFSDAKTGQTATMADVIKASLDAPRLPQGVAQGSLDTSAIFERGSITVPNGCHAAEVEIDPDTGVVTLIGFWAVDDFGNVINPMLADGQVMGGIVQGIGQALLEEIVYDRTSGQLVTGSLMDYALPRADHVPPMTIAYYEGAPTKKNPLGVKGAGEAGCCGAPPAIVNAVLDALKEWHVLHLDMPLTSEKVWRAVHGK